MGVLAITGKGKKKSKVTEGGSCFLFDEWRSYRVSLVGNHKWYVKFPYLIK